MGRIIGKTQCESHGLGGANRHTGSAIGAFLTKIIPQRIKPELTDHIAFSTIVAVFNNAADTHQTVAAEQ